ncbi:MAG: NRAMP family divalent metal transporter [Planctomycetota bacterium]
MGVSHLVQSTRAGANFGFALILVIVVANVIKYPAFSFGPRYAAATGTSLLEGYRRRGLYALVLYAILTLGTMFTVQAAVTIVTGALGSAVLGWSEPWRELPPYFWLSCILTAVCAGLLFIGHYRWLDKIVKVVVVVLTLSTVTATVLVLPKIPWGEMRFLPPRDIWTNLWLAALIGWMPSAFDISIWHSLWTLARRRETKHAPSVRESLLDFKIGYLGTAILSLCFLTLGVGVMFTAGKSFGAPPGKFAAQVVQLYVENLGEWSRPLIGLAAFTVMFSTTLTVVDGFPRAIACLVSRFKEPEVPDRPTSLSRGVYWGSLVVLGIGSLAIIGLAAGSLKGLIDLATTLSFLTAPALAWLNHRAILGSEVPVEHRPGPRMVVYSWAGILFSAVFALYFLYVRFL